MDPLTGNVGTAALHPGAGGQAQVYLQLAPGESLIVRTATAAGATHAAAWAYVAPAGEATEIRGTWQISFVKGGPELPPALQTTELKSWTELGGDEAKRAFETMMTMTKIDVAAIKAARRG